MKKLIFIIIICFETVVTFAQFGGGTGTEADPYRIYTNADFEEFYDSLKLQSTFTGKHFRLMNNIEAQTTSITENNNTTFNGIFNGCGYSIDITNIEDSFLFSVIGSNGCLDSIKFIGSTYALSSIISGNDGIIRNCVSDITILHPAVYYFFCVFCSENNYTGLIESCINLSDFTNIINPNTGAADIFYFAGICYHNYGIIRKCTNKGNADIKMGSVAGIAIENIGTIDLCINTGNLIGDCMGYYDNSSYAPAGITCLIFTPSIIRNCINTGDILFDYGFASGGIISDAFSYAGECSIENCLNTGKIYGHVGQNHIISGGGIIGEHNATTTINNCLNIGNSTGGGLLDSLYNPIFFQNITLNYYDKQMCLSKGINGADILGSAEGKLTTQLVGNSPELQAMLGDGWSYAEGRYPIPLGLENDSMALVAATPVYLDFEDEDNYNHVDSVTKNFTVGLENNVTWEEANGRVSFNNENATLLSIGTEKLTASLGNYSKEVRINILDIEPINIQENITEKGISIYPNPANDFININLNGITADKIEICDITGKIILSQSFSGDNSAMYIGNIKPGMYFLNIYIENQQLTTTKFVKE